MDYALLIPECINYYLEGFRKADYPTCFQRYCQQTEEVFPVFLLSQCKLRRNGGGRKEGGKPIEEYGNIHVPPLSYLLCIL